LKYGTEKVVVDIGRKKEKERRKKDKERRRKEKGTLLQMVGTSNVKRH